MKRAAFRLLTGLLLLLTVATSVSVPAQTAHATDSPNLHPMLQRLAATKPDEQIEVIVQVTHGATLHLPAGSARLSSFPMMDGHVVRMTARAAAALAASPAVRYISPNGQMRINFSADVTTTFPATLSLPASFWKADDLGAGVGVAVLDSGIGAHDDLPAARRVDVAIPLSTLGTADGLGHGTHVAGIIAGASADGHHVGVAPAATLYNLKIADGQGQGRESDLLRALQWVDENASRYNIRVVNISAQSALAQDYRTSPLCAAVERLWLRGIVVVVSAGNRGSASDAMYYPPANDPYVITVGALGENGTVDRSDDVTATFSSRGQTQEGYAKPDILAPGSHIIAPLAPGALLGQTMPDRVVDGGQYIWLSGTSMAAPMVSGLAADILSARPGLKPDQVKWLVTNQTYPTDSVPAVAAEQVASYLSANPLDSQIPTANQATAATNGASKLADSPYWDTVYWENVYWENVYWENAYLE